MKALGPMTQALDEFHRLVAMALALPRDRHTAPLTEALQRCHDLAQEIGPTLKREAKAKGPAVLEDLSKLLAPLTGALADLRGVLEPLIGRWVADDEVRKAREAREGK